MLNAKIKSRIAMVSVDEIQEMIYFMDNRIMISNQI